MFAERLVRVDFVFALTDFRFRFFVSPAFDLTVATVGAETLMPFFFKAATISFADAPGLLVAYLRISSDLLTFFLVAIDLLSLDYLPPRNVARV